MIAVLARKQKLPCKLSLEDNERPEYWSLLAFSKKKTVILKSWKYLTEISFQNLEWPFLPHKCWQIHYYLSVIKFKAYEQVSPNFYKIF